MERAQGVDVSRWQGSIDWKAVKASGVDFAIVKATEGLDFTDPSFTPGRVHEMHAAGLMVSMYHFARPQPGRTGAQEAAHFLATVKKAGYGQRGDIPLVLDLESTKLSAPDTLNFARAFTTAVRSATGRSPFIYTFPSFWIDTLGNPLDDLGCPLWIAHYGVKEPTVPRAWRFWTLWQTTDSGRAPGIRGPVDLNLYRREVGVMRGALMDSGSKKKPAPAKPSKKAPSNHYPKGLPVKYRPFWDRPWTATAARNAGFRKWLDDHGYLTPHFRLSEAKCKDGSRVPTHLNRRCRDHAFKLEKLRHELGDRPIPTISWYRTRRYNTAIGGASASKHLEAIATDHPREWVESVGRAKVLAAGNRVFARGGMGTYPWGALHFDTRGARARWSSW